MLQEKQAEASEPRWIEYAKSMIGIKEYAGKENNPKIVAMHATTLLAAKDDETPWCSSFVNWCLIMAGIKGTNSAAAKSWATWGQGILKPKYGAIAVLKGEGDHWIGHVGFYFGQCKDPTKVWILGGNQSNQVKISQFPKSNVLAYRWPK